jgi:hypothetical protein
VALETKEQFHSLLTLFPTVDRRTVYELKRWREAAGMLAMCIRGSSLQALQTFYPEAACELVKVLESSGQLADSAKTYFAEQAFCYPPQFFKFTKPLSLVLTVQPESPVKVMMGQPLLLEVSAKLRHIPRRQRKLQISAVFTKFDSSDSCEPLEQLRELDAAGTASSVLQVKLPAIGRWRVMVSVSLVSERLNQMGKSESCELCVDCD